MADYLCRLLPHCANLLPPPISHTTYCSCSLSQILAMEKSSCFPFLSFHFISKHHACIPISTLLLLLAFNASCRGNTSHVLNASNSTINAPITPAIPSHPITHHFNYPHYILSLHKSPNSSQRINPLINTHRVDSNPLIVLHLPSFLPHAFAQCFVILFLNRCARNSRLI